MKANALPLSGTRVVDFSNLMPLAWCSQVLGDFGADVIKVERPGSGDPGRHGEPTYRNSTVYFHTTGRNKRSLALDLGSVGGREVAHRLIESADIVLENHRPGMAERFGIDYASAKQINPAVVYCTLTPFGRTGPLAEVPGHDLAIQAMAGLLHGDYSGGRNSPNFIAADYAGAAMATIAIMGAVLRKRATGEGAFLDVAMYDSLMSMSSLFHAGALARLAGKPQSRDIPIWGGNPRYGIYPTKDGKAVAVTLLEPKGWADFCRVAGREDLIRADESQAERLSSHGTFGGGYREAIATFCGTNTQADVVARLNAAGVPVCAVLTPDESLVSDATKSRGVIQYVTDPAEGRVPRINSPFAASGIVDMDRRPPPALDADRAAVLADIGFDTQDTQRLAGIGAFGAKKPA